VIRDVKIDPSGPSTPENLRKVFDLYATGPDSYEYYAETDNPPSPPAPPAPIYQRLGLVKQAIEDRRTALLPATVSKAERDRVEAEIWTLKSSVRTYDFVCSLESSEEFEKNYRKYYQYHLSLIPAGAPEREKKAAIAVAHEFRDAIHFLNNNILFGQVVNQSGDPIIEFQTAATQGNPYVNPFTMYSPHQQRHQRSWHYGS
jgi:hypothetical protein